MGRASRVRTQRCSLIREIGIRSGELGVEHLNGPEVAVGDTPPGKISAALKVGALGAVASLLGASMGVAGTLFVTRQNLEAAQVREARALRATAYDT